MTAGSRECTRFVALGLSCRGIKVGGLLLDRFVLLLQNTSAEQFVSTFASRSIGAGALKVLKDGTINRKALRSSSRFAHILYSVVHTVACQDPTAICQSAGPHSDLTRTDGNLTMQDMGDRITVRMDGETARILQELQKRSGNSKSEVIRGALRRYWTTVTTEDRPTSWEVYQQLYPMLTPPRKGQPLHDRAQHVSRLLKEKLIAKRRNGTL